MKLNSQVKILIGLATAGYALFPVLLIPLWLIAVLFAGLGVNSYQNEPPPIFFFFFFGMFPLIILVNMLHFILIPFYLVHVIKNRPGREMYRILLGIGLFFLPWLAMPLYFLLYVWPDRPPKWALDAFANPAPPVAPAAAAVDLDISQPVEPQAAVLVPPAVSELPSGELPAEGENLPGDATTIQPPPQEIGPVQETKKPRLRRAGKKAAEPDPAISQDIESTITNPPAEQDHSMISPDPFDGDDGEQA
jgi:hypothetical protein